MQPAPDIVELVRRWFEAASNGDPSLVERHVPPEPQARLVGSDPGEWFAGGTEIAAFLRGEVEGGGGRATFTPSETEAFSEGTVGWAASKVTIRLPDGKHVSPRWTSVFVKRDGTWMFAQTHASIAVPNEEIGWSYD